MDYQLCSPCKCIYYFKTAFIVSKETVVLRRWGSERRNGLINWVEMVTDHCNFRNLKSDKGLTLEMPAFKFLYGGQFTIINSVDKPISVLA